MIGWCYVTLRCQHGSHVSRRAVLGFARFEGIEDLGADGPDLLHQALLRRRGPDLSASTMAGAGLESIVTPFWRIRRIVLLQPGRQREPQFGLGLRLAASTASR